MADLSEPSSAPPAPPSRTPPFREDCWSEDATATLVDAWARRYLELNRGNLRQKDWQDVANAVNARHGHTKKTLRTDIQCKNRIDTLKKKYKTEKARVSESNGTVPSSWSFFSRLDVLIGSGLKKPSPSPPLAVALPYREPVPIAVMKPVVLPQKRPSSAVDDSYFRRNYSAVAAAAAAAEEGRGSEEEEEALGMSEESGGAGGQNDGQVEGMKQLARAIERFGEIYERVEGEKQRQMIELEKQRMQFAKDLEVQRMQLFMDTQVQLEKVKQAKRLGSGGKRYTVFP